MGDEAEVQPCQALTNTEEKGDVDNIESADVATSTCQVKSQLRKKRKRRKRFTRIKRRNQNSLASYSSVAGYNPIQIVSNKLKRGAAIIANRNRLKKRRKLLEKDLDMWSTPVQPPPRPPPPPQPPPPQAPPPVNTVKKPSSHPSRLANRISLQERRKMLEAAIANDAAKRNLRRKQSSLTDVSTSPKYSVDRFAHLADDELNILMEPEIVIETQDECFVEYNMESSSVSAPEPSRLLHFLSANSDYDPSITNERATAPQQNIPQKLRHHHQKSHEVRIPSLTALVKVPVGKILCNFGHVIEQARKLERHTLRCGLGGEMVYHMTLKTGSVYEAIYRCSQPSCAVRMTIESDFQDKSLS